MDRQDILDAFEQDIEDNFESLQSIEHVKEEIAVIQQAAVVYKKRKKSSED